MSLVGQKDKRNWFFASLNIPLHLQLFPHDGKYLMTMASRDISLTPHVDTASWK